MAKDTTSVGFRYRNAFDLLTCANHKTPKGEGNGWLTGILYLSPHTSAGGPTLCPHSTPACREMCLAGAGLSGLPRQLEAKHRRTRFYLEHREAFLEILLGDIELLKQIAEEEGMRPALRLNGSSDILWEREDWLWSAMGLQRYDYTAIPLEHRRTDPGYHLTYSYKGPQDADRALAYLKAGHSVAAVVPQELKDKRLPEPGWRSPIFPYGIWAPNDHIRYRIVDGDAHDLRFLDPPGSIVLLSPKGHVRSDLIRPELFRELSQCADFTAALAG